MIGESIYVHALNRNTPTYRFALDNAPMHKREQQRRHPGEILDEIMKARNNMSDNELARLSKVSQPTITRIRNRQSRDPKNETLDKLARALRIAPAALRYEIREPDAKYQIEPGPDVTVVPLISWVQAGRLKEIAPLHRVGDGDKLIYTTRRVGPDAYALRLRGDSMENPNGKPTFPDGCVIVIDPSKMPDLGSFVVVRFEDRSEATFKQLVEDAGKRFLKPLNPRYPLIPLDGNATLCGTWVQTIIDSD